MAKTKLMTGVREALAAAASGGRRTTSRRGFIVGAAALGALTASAARAAKGFAGPTSTPARIAVIGAGLAGLTAAYRLKQAGLAATVYEASDRVGGRCWTLRGHFADGQIAERGGELIDNSHLEIKQLCQELRLPLDNLLQAETNGTEPLFYFDGAPYSVVDATNDLKKVWQKIKRDVSAASYPTVYNSFTQRGLELDNMSILDWIAESVPGGVNSRLGQLLDVAYNIEYGGESSTQSSLNLLYLLGYKGQGQLRLFGPSNEKFHVRGGNDQIATRLAERLPGQILTGHELKAVRQNPDGTFRLIFRSGGADIFATFDKVVMTVPFPVLRNSVDLTQAGFKPLKMTAIDELAMGTNSKLQLQFTSRHWDTLGGNGDSYSDTGYQATWHVTRGQAGASGILVDYTGGNIGNSFTGSADFHARAFLPQLEPVMPGITQRWNGRASLDYWPANRWSRGSYAFWKVGQYTRFVGVEREREGNCHFAGEHTSLDFQGYLNGAVESGERAAAEILGDLG